MKLFSDNDPTISVRALIEVATVLASGPIWAQVDQLVAPVKPSVGLGVGRPIKSKAHSLTLGVDI